ncbi:hypothetical protein MKZ38_010129 [Zalerion maritima]|uniref:Uncharacterized protein n=1 Tax=Zalerion maritima TaxID=339359 RepID=A0AAD5WMZ2_9PEZI|nr:hypothetical protein MKZ38_010129 [Zalerion maritima]
MPHPTAARWAPLHVPSLALVAGLFPRAAAGSDLDDFSNNLATDIAPLVALFGEQMTKQFLSESLTWLDYFIFAMAPIGIVTTLSSVIRVCGSSALRAFIGRAQEGTGQVEVELGTSTGRDVCELFNNGSITRALGQSAILEIIRDPGRADDENMGLFIFHGYLHSPLSDGRWEKAEKGKKLGAYFGRWDRLYRRWIGGRVPTGRAKNPRPHLSIRDGLNPNLSINVGIKTVSHRYFYAVGSLGLFLQSGVVVMAVALSLPSISPETVQSEKLGVLNRPAAYVFAGGTSCLAIGMFLAAKLIGNNTKEQEFRRVGKQKQRIFWLQPGNIRVGDQTFDPFAYSETPSKYIMSRKRNQERAAPTWLSLFLIVVGYVAQFVGLRGLTAYVSMAQLGVTALISVLRGTLRMKRLDRNSNEVVGRQDHILGHELDWLAFRILESGGEGHDGSPDVLIRRGLGPDSLSRMSDLGTAILYRVRLANLTGIGSLSAPACQEWKESQVKVRAQARVLSTALCRVVERVLGAYLPVAFTIDFGNSRVVKLPVRKSASRPQERSPFDPATVEGILGSCLWCLITNRQLQRNSLGPEATGQGHLTPDGLEDESDDGDNLAPTDVRNIRLIPSTETMRLWGDDTDINLVEASFEIRAGQPLDPFALWNPDGSQHRSRSKPYPKGLTRIFGLAHPPMLSRGSQTDPAAKATDWFGAGQWYKDESGYSQQIYAHASGPLLQECSKDIFICALASVASADTVRSIPTTCITIRENIRFESTLVNDLAAIFEEAGLGSRTDALLCILPPLQRKMTSLDMDCMVHYARSKRKAQMADGYWFLINTINMLLGLQQEPPAQVLAELFDSLRRVLGHEHQELVDRDFIFSIIASYFYSMYECQETARVQVCYAQVFFWILSEVGQRSNPKVASVLEHLQGFLGQHQHVDPEARPFDPCPPPFHDGSIAQAINARNRPCAIHALWKDTRPSMAPQEGLDVVLHQAARCGWDEVVANLLERGASPNYRDGDGLTAAHHCAGDGDPATLATLLCAQGFDPNVIDFQRRTPLHIAAQNGRAEAVGILLKTHGTGIGLEDQRGNTPLILASKEGHLQAVVAMVGIRQVNVNARNALGNSALACAAEEGHHGIVDLLLGVFDIMVDVVNASCATPLMVASRNGHAEVVKLLVVRGGANVNAVVAMYGMPRETSLIMACCEGHSAVVEFLLGGGKADVNIPKDGENALKWAMRNQSSIDEKWAGINQPRRHLSVETHDGAEEASGLAMPVPLQAKITVNFVDLAWPPSCASAPQGRLVFHYENHKGVPRQWHRASSRSVLAASWYGYNMENARLSAGELSSSRIFLDDQPGASQGLPEPRPNYAMYFPVYNPGGRRLRTHPNSPWGQDLNTKLFDDFSRDTLGKLHKLGLRYSPLGPKAEHASSATSSGIEPENLP